MSRTHVCFGDVCMLHFDSTAPSVCLMTSQVHQAAVGALRSELAGSAARLAQVTEENSQLQGALSTALVSTQLSILPFYSASFLWDRELRNLESMMAQ